MTPPAARSRPASACQPARGHGDPARAMTLPGPSRRIIVVPVEAPERAPAEPAGPQPAPEREPVPAGPPEPVPAETPEREREPAFAP